MPKWHKLLRFWRRRFSRRRRCQPFAVFATPPVHRKPDRPDVVDSIGSARHLTTWPRRCECGRPPVKAAGFSLVEVLVATVVVTVGVASLAQLIVLSARANRIATTTSVTVLLAEQKMEELLGNPAESSDQGHLDYLGQGGMSLGVEGVSLGTPPQGTAYICQWSIAPLPDGSGAAIVIQVLVAPWPDAPGQSRLVSVKTRKAS